jgi:hypothetical protein
VLPPLEQLSPEGGSEDDGGEGTPVDVAGARATFRRMMGGRTDMDADQMNLDAIIKKREANPTAKATRGPPHP